MRLDQLRPTAYGGFSALMIMIMFSIYYINETNHQDDVLSAETLDKVRDIQRDVARQIDSDLVVAQGLGARIAIGGDISAKEFDAWGARLVTKHSYVRRLTLSHGTVIWRTFPLIGNEHVIGLDYLKDNDRKQAVQMAISTHRTVVSQPVQLKESGGHVIFVRVPIWLGLPEGAYSDASFFGLISIVVDVSKILSDVQAPETGLHTDIALRILVSGDETSETIIGDKSVFSSPHVTSDLIIDGNCRIQLGAVVDAKKSNYRDNAVSFLILELTISGMIGGLVFALSRSYEQHRHLAMHDPLTHLANCRLIKASGAQVLRQAHRNNAHAAALMLDLDNFKAINDTYGHSVGDLVLTSVARRLTSTARSCDIVGRLGGDEFVIIVSSPTTREDCMTMAERLVTALDLPIDAPGFHFRVGVSIGIGIYPDDGADVETLIRTADAVMYHVKSLPIRLTQTPTTCWVRPIAGVEFSVGRRLSPARDPQQ